MEPLELLKEVGGYLGHQVNINLYDVAGVLIGGYIAWVIIKKSIHLVAAAALGGVGKVLSGQLPYVAASGVFIAGLTAIGYGAGELKTVKVRPTAKVAVESLSKDDLMKLAVQARTDETIKIVLKYVTERNTEAAQQYVSTPAPEEPAADTDNVVRRGYTTVWAGIAGVLVGLGFFVRRFSIWVRPATV